MIRLQWSCTLRPYDRIVSVLSYEISNFLRIVYLQIKDLILSDKIVYFSPGMYTLNQDRILSVMIVNFFMIVYFSRSSTFHDLIHLMIVSLSDWTYHSDDWSKILEAVFEVWVTFGLTHSSNVTKIFVTTISPSDCNRLPKRKPQ